MNPRNRPKNENDFYRQLELAKEATRVDEDTRAELEAEIESLDDDDDLDDYDDETADAEAANRGIEIN